MQVKRSERVAELIKHELASVFTKGLKDPRVGFVTVTTVEVSDDLRYARVFYTVLGKEAEQEETAKGLEAAKGYLQHDLAVTLKLRFTPHLSFILDSSMEEGMKIDSIIRKIHEQ